MPKSINSKVVMISNDLYERIKPLTNNKGGRNKDKKSFTTEITRAFDVHDQCINSETFKIP